MVLARLDPDREWRRRPEAEGDDRGSARSGTDSRWCVGGSLEATYARRNALGAGSSTSVIRLVSCVGAWCGSHEGPVAIMHWHCHSPPPQGTLRLVNENGARKNGSTDVRPSPRCGSNKSSKKGNTCLAHRRIDLVGVTSLPRERPQPRTK